MDTPFFEACKRQLNDDEYKLIVDEKNLQNGEIFVIAPVLYIVSLVCSLSVIIFIGMALRKHTVSKRKSMIILSRTLADVTVSLIIFGIGILGETKTIAIVCLLVCTFGFIHTALCNVFLILIRHISHEETALYKSFLSVQTIAWIICLLWAFSIFYSAVYAPLIFAFFKPLNECSFYACQKSLILFCIIIMGMLFALTTCYYLFVLRRLFVSMVKERANGEIQIYRRRFKHFLAFGLHISLFAVISMLLVVLMCFVLHNGFYIEKILNQNIEECQIFEYLETVNRIQTLCNGIVLLWIVRMVFDPILLFSIEYQRLLSWLKHFRKRSEDNDESLSSSSVQRSESLKWKKNIEEVHSITGTMNQTISAWDSTNGQNIYQNQ